MKNKLLYSEENYLQISQNFLNNSKKFYEINMPQPYFKSEISANFQFKAFCIQAAKAINSQFEKYYLLFSGGVDSQAMVLSFLMAEIRPRVIVLRYPNKTGGFFNNDDIESAEAFLKKHSQITDIQFLDLDLLSFYETGQHWLYAEKYKCSSPQLTVHMWAQDLINQPCLLSWNIPNIYTHKSRPAILTPNFKFFSYLRFLEINSKAGVPFFFLYYPEMFYASLLLPSLRQEFKKTLPPNYITPYRTKVSAYNEAGFEVVAQKQKFTGFEQFKIYYSQLKCPTDQDFFNRSFRYPLEKKFDDHVLLKVNLDRKFFQDYFYTDEMSRT